MLFVWTASVLNELDSFFRSLILNTTCAVLRLTSLTSTANEKFTANIHTFHEIHTQILNLNAFTCTNMHTWIQRYNGHAIVNEIILLVLRAFSHSIISAAGYMLFLRFYIQPIHSSSQAFFRSTWPFGVSSYYGGHTLHFERNFVWFASVQGLRHLYFNCTE